MSLGKHFINDIQDPVQHSLITAARIAPDLRVRPEEHVLFRELTPENKKVILLSGGGSGHEPAHSGYVGEGMLDVVIAGNIFASPSASQIMAGINSVECPRGVLMIVKNYTGDKLNFGLAAQKAKALGINVETVMVGDDVSVTGNAAVGRRGLAGVVFVHKIAGALAANGVDLDVITKVARKVSNQMATAAASLDRCNVPRREVPEPLPVDEVEFGMGIHNEPGVMRKKLQSLDKVVQNILDIILAPGSSFWQPELGQPVAVMINNLGGLSVLEISVVADEVLRQLDARGILIERCLFGTFVSALDGPGFSVTLLGLDDEILPLLDHPTTAPGWPNAMSTFHKDVVASKKLTDLTTGPAIQPVYLGPKVPKSLVAAIVNSIEGAVKQDEPLITKYDTVCGDGDCGETLLNGVTGLVGISEALDCDEVYLAHIFRQVATIAERNMGGTSGAIYAIYLNAVAESLQRLDPKISNGSIDTIVATALREGLEDLCKFTTAREGHRTLMDALIPFLMTFSRNQDFNEAFLAALKGCEKTRMMEASLGRASYVGKDRFVENGGIPDPGALGVVSILRGIKGVIENSAQTP